MTPTARPRLSVIMPVHNEERTLREIVDRVLAAACPADIELIIVDDGSTDGSRAIIAELAGRHPDIRSHRQDPNRGKGAAVRKGLELASGDWVLIQDADLEYDPADYARLLEPALAGAADAVYGSRFAPSADCRRARRWWHTLGNRALTAASNLLNGQRLSDMETCYKLIRADLAKRLRLRSNAFTIEPEITARLAQCRARVVEVPISYRGRTYAEGKNIGPWDAVEALAAMLYCRFLGGPPLSGA
ncbi:MAG TPA: glycosyltransferase family 2 protein [Planctomycetota bacterium]|nr:glycosyltransferase family 2 protein [Planctomycetota bacterium]